MHALLPGGRSARTSSVRSSRVAPSFLTPHVHTSGLSLAGACVLAVVLLIMSAPAVASVTGTVLFTDAQGHDIGTAYAARTTHLYVQVTDPDRDMNPGARDNLGVILTSPSEPAGETAVLVETDAHSGVFRGGIALDLLTGVTVELGGVRRGDGDEDILVATQLLGDLLKARRVAAVSVDY